MTNNYENLEEIEIFEEKTPSINSYDIESEYLKSQAEDVDALFSDADVIPLIYPADDTLYSMTTRKEMEEGEEATFALVGDFSEYLTELDEEDFEYHGQYIRPKATEDISLKINVEETSSIPIKGDLELENIAFEIPIDEIIP